MNDEELIHGCKEASPNAQRGLLEKYTGLLYSVALRYAVDRSDAQDILQESWIKIFNGILKYKEEGRLTGWMTRIVINTALRKKQGFHSRTAVYVEVFNEDPMISPLALDKLHYDDLLKIVNMLPEMGREVFKMSAIDGLKHKEIAEILQIEESTSRAHLTRSRKKLQELVNNTDLAKEKSYGE